MNCMPDDSKQITQPVSSKKPKKPRKETDGPWKDALEFFLEQFFALFFPDWGKQINWKKKPKALTPDLPDQSGTKICDRIFEVELLNGEKEIIFLHLEIQGQKQEELPHRMMTYNFGTHKKHGKPVVSIAIALDKKLVCSSGLFEQIHPFKNEPYLQFWYDIIKIWSFKGREEELKKKDNIFALVVLAQLAIMDDKNDQELRKHKKTALFRELFTRGLKKDIIEKLYKIIDWLIPLDPKHMIALQEEIQQTAQTENWPGWDPVYVNTFEQVGMIKGREKGRQEGLRSVLDKQLRRRFPHDITAKHLHLLEKADSDTLAMWAENLMDAKNIDEVFATTHLAHS